MGVLYCISKIERSMAVFPKAFQMCEKREFFKALDMPCLIFRSDENEHTLGVNGAKWLGKGHLVVYITQRWCGWGICIPLRRRDLAKGCKVQGDTAAQIRIEKNLEF